MNKIKIEFRNVIHRDGKIFWEKPAGVQCTALKWVDGLSAGKRGIINDLFKTAQVTTSWFLPKENSGPGHLIPEHLHEIEIAGQITTVHFWR